MTSFYISIELLGSTGIRAYDLVDDIFVFSNGLVVEYGTFILNGIDNEFEFKRTTIALPGISALIYLPEFQMVLCLSENCVFYTIPVQHIPVQQGYWKEIDRNLQKYITNLKYELIELTDVYDNLLEQQLEERKIRSVIDLKRNDMFAIEIGNNHRFRAVCSVTQTEQTNEDFTTNAIYIPDSLINERVSSFFVNINICYTVMYANEFDAKLWRICCRWLNDEYEYVCAIIEYTKFQPISTKIVIHLQQKHLPIFYVDVSTNVRSGDRSALLIFPTKVEQPVYCEMMKVSIPTVDIPSIGMYGKSLICTVSVPKSIPLNEILEEKIHSESRSKEVTSTHDIDHKYEMFLFEKRMTAIHNPRNEALCLYSRDNDIDIMHAFKKYFHQINEKKLSIQRYNQELEVSTDALKEYNVSRSNCSML